MSKVLVGIANYKDTEYLRMLLQSIRWYTYKDDPDFDIVVCDDGSGDEWVNGKATLPGVADVDSVSAICAFYGATLICHEKNLGIPATWNHLVEALGGKHDIVLLLNNDMLMVPGWLKTVVHFLEANRHNPHVGSVFLQPRHVPRDNPKDVFKAILPTIGHTVWKFDDLCSGAERHHEWLAHQELQARLNLARSERRLPSREQEGQGLGRVMCPCGCSFAFTRDVWNRVGPFDERLTSFHEESDWGTRCASMGLASYALPYPRPYHVISGTFMQSPELQQSERMVASRRLYRQIWNVPAEIEPGGAGFSYVHERYMSAIPRTTLKFLTPDYSQPPSEHTLVGGEVVLAPVLVEKEWTC